MAKKERSKPPSAQVEVNMTPMIDVVFNLIIFFMIITDMTQKDLEYLVLPKANMAEEDPGEDKERIIVNIVNFATELNQDRIRKGDVNPKWPPIFVDGKQVRDLEHMRAELRKKSDPLRFPDLDKGEIAPGIRPSRKPVLVRCDQGQLFGWVQAVMQYCSIVPGRTFAQELKESPLIYKMEIAVAERDAGS